MATGKGLTADAIYAGYLSAERIEAGSITTDKLSATVGQELEIGSNKSLALYATIDGERPAGSLITQHPQASDSWVAIGAQSDNNPAYVDIQSGGQVNLYGGSEINIDSQGALNLSGATVDLTSNGKMTIDGGTIDIKSSGVLLVDSENFSIKKNETTGKYDVTIKGNITTTGGKIAGFTIGSASNRDYMYAGQTVTVNSNANGVYLGTDGINVAGKFKFSADGNTAKLNVNASDITLGDIAGFTSLSGKLGDMDTKTSTAQSTADTAKANAATAQSTADNIANGTTAVPKVETTGIKIYKGTDNKGHIEVGSTGTIDMLANSSLTFATSSSNSAFVLNNDGVSIGSAKDISIAAGGTFTISSGKFKIKNDGTVEIDGKITTTSGSIGTWTIGADYIGNASTKNNSTVGIANASGNNDIVFWAGGKYNGTGTNAPKFSVTKAGKLVASGAEIKGDSTFSGTLSADCLTSGTLNASKVTVSNLSANSITSGTIDASKISVTNLSASNITSGTMSANKISGGSIDATNVTITNLNASNITSGTMSANKISGGSIDATNVTITNLNASNITSGTMSANKISGGTLTLGGNDNGNGTLVINNASNVQIGSWNNNGITATAGTIGGWTITGSSTVKRLSSGSGSTYVGLDSGSTNMDYAIWVGADSPTGDNAAPFSVKRDGSITITDLYVLDKNNNLTKIKLKQAGLWKLTAGAGATIYSLTTDGDDCTSMTFSNAVSGHTTVNFKKATSVKIVDTWTGGVTDAQAMIRATNSDETITYDTLRFSLGYGTIRHVAGTKTYSVPVTAKGTQVMFGTDIVDASAVFEDGVTEGKGAMGIGISATDHTVSVVVGTTKLMNVEAAADAWSNGATTIRANIGGVTVASDTLDAPSASVNDAGWSGGINKVTATHGSKELGAKNVYLPDIGGIELSTAHTGMLWTATVTLGGGTKSHSVDCTSAYNAGWNACLDACGFGTYTKFYVGGSYARYAYSAPVAGAEQYNYCRYGAEMQSGHDVPARK